MSKPNEPELTPTLECAADLMTASPVTTNADASLYDVHQLMREYNIRHIPVTDDKQHLVGMLTQKVIIAQVMKIISVFGADALERKEKQTHVRDIMLTSFDTVESSDQLIDIAKFFLNNRHGCMPVLEAKKLVGVLTSSDFVRLSITLMEKS
ncbi:CBS domain-containing protein [Pseudoalteromonas sp. BDTF-M6]|uniref:CBS domain-containing protein n=1 Tax=Pseudoalteromonas sp. BDTF-M6 TaxID=2796132 RepID=UPI001BB03123|nr:CBS domain-containing protein [Pseudoalteromonas sp. BDTF-M6]MBS3796539.1 CBS domain-containing protein [Pseudoalteromonas sp. BDTF-M6]